MARASRDRNLNRSLKIDDRAKFDPDKLTLRNVAFSSEAPVERWGENEVLSHERGDYDFSRLNNDHPFLLGHAEHDPHSQIGVIEKAWVEDGMGRCDIRFSDSPDAKQIFKDMQGGIRKLVSVGYDRTGIVESKKAKDGMVTTRYRWMPTHVASVPVPADITVGVGRAIAGAEGKEVCTFCGHEECESCEDEPNGGILCCQCHQIYTEDTAEEEGEKSKSVDSPRKTTKAKQFMDKETTVQIDETKVREDERNKARTATQDEIKRRSKEIVALTDVLIKDHGEKDGGKCRDGLHALANEMLTEKISEDRCVDDFKLRAWELIAKAKPAKPILIEDCTDEAGQRNYSLLRGIQSAFTAREKGGAPIPDGLEGEVHQEFVRKATARGGLGYAAAGFQVPANAPVRLGRSDSARNQQFARDMQVQVFGSGGALVPTQLVVPVIEILRNMSVLDKVGKRTMAGLQGNIVIPRQTAAGTAYSVAEIAALTATGQVLDQIALQPKRVGATENYSKQLVFQSTPDAEAFIRDDLFKVIALRWDYLGLNGQGANSEPLGILQTAGVNSVTFAATPTYIKMVAFRTAIEAANVIDPLAWISTPAVKGALSTVAEALTGATTVGGAQNAIWKPGPTPVEGEMVGMPAHSTNQMPNNQVMLGAFTHLIHAVWGGLDVVVDIYTKAANAEVVLTINTWGDYALRHPQAFCISTDAGNQ